MCSSSGKVHPTSFELETRLLTVRKTDGRARDGRQHRLHGIHLWPQCQFPQPQVSYNVSKGALLQLKSSLAAEWARYGIRVNSISPGYMDTILNEGPGLEEARKLWYSRNPMGRMGDPSELTGVVVLLCSRAGRYINGADILVDGMVRNPGPN